jgi:hypothetical protein
MISDEQLLHYNALGIIPGPEEAEETFIARALYCLNLKNLLEKEGGKILPFAVNKTKFPYKQLRGEESANLLAQFFDIDPQWVPIFMSNYHLAPWHGGCAWIFQLQGNTPKSAFLQLREESSIFSDRQELIAHELAHVGRMGKRKCHLCGSNGFNHFS